MDSPRSLEHLSGKKSGPDDGPIAIHSETSKDVDRITYTFYPGDDGSAPCGPYCTDCTNQMFRSGKLDAISTVFVFTNLGFIPFPIRTLVFMNGVDNPFSLKEIAEDFLVMPCSNCSENNAKKNTIHALDCGKLEIVCDSPSRKRKIVDPPSNEKLFSTIVKEELISSPICNKMVEDVAVQSAASLTPIINNKIFGIPSSPKAPTAGKGGSKKGVNSTTTTEQNKSSVNVKGTTFSMIVEEPSLTGESAGGILGNLMSQFGSKPVVVDNSQNAQNINKESTSSSITSRKSVTFDTVTTQNDATSRALFRESGTVVDKLKCRTEQSAGDISGNMMGQFGQLPVVLSTKGNKADVENVNKEPTIQTEEDCLHSIPPAARLKDDCNVRNERACEAKISNVNRQCDQGSSKTSSLVKDKVAAILPMKNRQWFSSLISVAERLKTSVVTNKLLEEDLLDSWIVGQAWNSLNNNGYWNVYLMIPFYSGAINEYPGISFECLYNGISFMNVSMNAHKSLFAKFMCILFPEIKNIRRCDFCEHYIPPSAKAGELYLSHFLSFDHIIQAMNRGRGFSRDFISLRKCLIYFFRRNGFRGPAKRLGGIKFDECIQRRQFSSGKKFFVYWRELLNKY